MKKTLGAAPTWLVLVAACALAACGQPNDQTTERPAPTEEPAVAVPPPATLDEEVEAVAPAEAVVVAPDGSTQVRIGSTDQMQYTVREFRVPAGQEVELTLVHEGRLAAQVMGHNVVILQPGEDYMAFGGEVMMQGGSMDNDYLPEGMRDRVIAYTSMIGGGESTSVTFTAPTERGEYPFLCTFPGHFGAMNGVMIVQ
jgi:azurin